ncbi:MAG: TIGR03546 family protein [Planctomycetes bacterium]|nr:TIGR03546 family protein [Planctomycetota bacterium]
MFLLSPLRYLAKALVLESTPRQMAWGFALGVAIGLVPKGNLIAVSLMTLLCALRVNIAAGTGAIALFAWIGMYFDPLSHRLGHYLLTRPDLQQFWTKLAGMRFVPWTDFNNTVVLGSTVIGLTAVLPVYFATRPIFEKFAPKLSAHVARFRLVAVLTGGDLATRVAS